MKPHKPENGMQIAELRYLRQKVKDLEAARASTTTAQPVTETKVDYKIDHKAIGTLRITLLKLLTAVENFTGPEVVKVGDAHVTVIAHKPTTELRQAMAAARALIQPNEKVKA